MLATHLRVLRQAEPLPLQLLDGRLHLREGGADVGQLDDVGVRGGRKRPQLREGVVLPLPVGEVRGEAGEDAARERDVAALHRQPRGPEVGLDDGQERVRGQRGGLVREGVDDLGGRGGGGRRPAPTRAGASSPRRRGGGAPGPLWGRGHGLRPWGPYTDRAAAGGAGPAGHGRCGRGGGGGGTSPEIGGEDSAGAAGEGRMAVCRRSGPAGAGWCGARQERGLAIGGSSGTRGPPEETGGSDGAVLGGVQSEWCGVQGVGSVLLFPQ